MTSLGNRVAPKKSKAHRLRLFYLFLLAAALSLFLVALGKPPFSAALLRNAWLSLTSPFFRVGSSAKHQLGTIQKNLLTLDQLEEEYHTLLDKNATLEAENQLLQRYRSKAEELEKALGYRTDSAFSLLPAEVISHDSPTWWDTIKINKGSQDGVAIDQVAVTPEGLVGKVIEVAPHLSVILLLTNESCKVAANIEGTDEQGIVSGERLPQQELQMTFLSKFAQLSPGQKVYTAGVVGGIFPSGITIGTIKNFEVKELDGEATLQPAVNFNQLERLFIITGAK